MFYVLVFVVGVVVGAFSHKYLARKATQAEAAVKSKV